MATAQTLIDRAVKQLGVLQAGGSLGASEANDALAVLNGMLQMWSIERLTVYVLTEHTHTLTGAQSYSVGSGGDINIDRPNRLDSAFIRQSSTDYPLEVLRAKSDYDSIYQKTTPGYPRAIYYHPTFPLGTLYLYPVGDASYTLHFNVWAPLSQFATLATDVNFPDGYEWAIVNNLAVSLAPSYGRPISNELALLATQTKAAIKSLNRESPLARFDVGIPTNARFNIETGGYD